MIKIGLREANVRFSKYVNMVKKGQEIVLTDRGNPVAVIKPVSAKKETEEERLTHLEDQGILKRASGGKFPLPKPVVLGGKSLSKIVEEEREGRF